VLPHTGSAHADHAADPGPRIAMLHAWLWATNPEGVFAVDNWGLAYVRLGLTVPAASPPGAAKSLSLLAGGVPFFAERFAAEPRAVPRDRATIDTALQDARRKADAIIRGRSGNELTSAELASLAAIWNEVERILQSF
jgi:hypothetical protein